MSPSIACQCRRHSNSLLKQWKDVWKSTVKHPKSRFYWLFLPGSISFQIIYHPGLLCSNGVSSPYWYAAFTFGWWICVFNVAPKALIWTHLLVICQRKFFHGAFISFSLNITRLSQNPRPNMTSFPQPAEINWTLCRFMQKEELRIHTQSFAF